MGFHTSMIACGSSVLIFAVGTWMNKVFCATFSYPIPSFRRLRSPWEVSPGGPFRGIVHRGWAATSAASSTLLRECGFARGRRGGGAVPEGVDSLVVVDSVVIVSAANLICLVILRVKSVTAGPASEDVSARTTI